MNRSPRPGGPPHRNGCNKRQPGVTTRTNFSLQQPVHLSSSSSSFCNYEEKNYENGWGCHKRSLLNVIVIHNKCAWQTIQNTTWNCKMQNAKCKIGNPCPVSRGEMHLRIVGQCMRKWDEINIFLSFIIQFFYKVFQIQHGP